MVMPNFLSRLKVRTPKYNIFQMPTVKNRLDMQIGRNYPVKWVELHPGEEVDINMRQLTRFMPMVNPIFHKVDIEFIPFFVPFRLLDEFGFNASDYFNPAIPDSERPSMPTISLKNLYSGIDGISGSIWDYLRYPTYSWLLRILQNEKNSFYTVSAVDTDDDGVYNYSSLVSVLPASGSPIGFTIESSNLSIDVDVYGFLGYCLREWVVAKGGTVEQFETLFPKSGHWETVNDEYQAIYEATGKRVDDLMNNYLVYLHNSLFNAFAVNNDLPDVSLLPWLCYSRLIYDWFVNTNLTDIHYVPSYFSQLLGDIASGSSFKSALSATGFYSDFPEWSYFFPFENIVGDGLVSGYTARVAFSLWQRDYFTGALPNSQSGDAVPIPANGTIPDLTGARKLQWFRTLNIFGGKRWIDQIWTHRGVRSSDARMDRCEVIGEKKVWNLQISDVLQTSQSTIDSVQGDFAGHGISYGGDHLCHYRAEEPGLVMVIGRVRPQNSYIDAVPKLIFKTDFYDFEQPEFDNVGMQPIMYNELQCAGDAVSNRVFGWTRRYGEYMTDFDEYHSHMQTSLSNWHMARMFDNGHPLLNTQFSVIKSDGSDELNRIFANPGYRWNVLAELTFDIAVSRPLSKVIEFDF